MTLKILPKDLMILKDHKDNKFLKEQLGKDLSLHGLALRNQTGTIRRIQMRISTSLEKILKLQVLKPNS